MQSMISVIFIVIFSRKSLPFVEMKNKRERNKNIMNMDIYTYLQSEIRAIQNTLEYSSKIKSKPLTELSFKILRELNNHEPDSGFKYYTTLGDSTLNKYPNVNVRDVQNQLNISRDELIEKLKALFVKRYVDFDLPLTEKINDILLLDMESKMDKNQLKHGLIFENNFENVNFFRLTERGFLAMMDYSIKEMEILKKELIDLNVRNNEQLSELKQLDSERVGAIGIIDEKIKITENSIKKFNENLFTIFSIMLAIFAVIGINVSSIPKIEGNFILNIVVINVSICFSLIVLFYLMNTMLYREKNKTLLTLLITFSVVIILAFIVIGLKGLV